MLQPLSYTQNKNLEKNVFPKCPKGRLAKSDSTHSRPNITRAKVENRFSRCTGFHKPVITVTKAVTVTKAGETPPRALARELI
jgi:hypothetical protein